MSCARWLRWCRRVKNQHGRSDAASTAALALLPFLFAWSEARQPSPSGSGAGSQWQASDLNLEGQAWFLPLGIFPWSSPSAGEGGSGNRRRLPPKRRPPASTKLPYACVSRAPLHRYRRGRFVTKSFLVAEVTLVCRSCAV